MSEMIERVAAALLRHAVGRGEEVWAILPEEAFGGRPRDAYRAQARAAIETIPNPTAEMIEAGRLASGTLLDGSSNSGGPRSWYLDRDIVIAVYNAMIEAALALPNEQ